MLSATFQVPQDTEIEPIGSVPVRSSGKFLVCGETKFWAKGITFGPFRPDEAECEYKNPSEVEKTFARMVANRINSIRTYTVPPVWFLDLAQQYGLRVLVGIPWEQHITFLDHRKSRISIRDTIHRSIRACRDHPAVFCYAIGNEIPASIVRWHGKEKIEHFLHDLYKIGKDTTSKSLLTYVNYPSTEYLELPFLDLVCFNVFLESRPDLKSYLARLQNIAGERPLLLTELGLDSQRKGKIQQAESIHWQIRSAFEAGCAGTYVFSWTDEWHRGGYDIEDWDFGLIDRLGNPKLALESTRNAYQQIPFTSSVNWPMISVIVCTFNGSRTIEQCLNALEVLNYPNYEVIVVNDGSLDNTAQILQKYNFRTVTTENRGLSAARNLGMELARGEILAYIDDDAYPDPDWLTYLGWTFLTTNAAVVGGPNLPPTDDGWIADCIAESPGRPMHVLLSDGEAEHVPGVNLAIRKSALQSIGGFDSRFRIAGDDVDVCWRIQVAGQTLAFCPAAIVWHHTRNSIKSYWRQQLNYGKAEAILASKWPQKYNGSGHVKWSGRVYSNIFQNGWGQRVYYGTWGLAPFQRLYHPSNGSLLGSIFHMPELSLLTCVFAFLSALGPLWRPFYFFGSAFLVLFLLSGFNACRNAIHAFSHPRHSEKSGKAALILITSLLHLIQPLARLKGRMFWRHPALHGFVFPWLNRSDIWSESWKSAGERLSILVNTLSAAGAAVLHGGNFDRYDLEIQDGLFGASRLRMTVEEHGAGKQLIRFILWPRFPMQWLFLFTLFLSVSVIAFPHSSAASTILFVTALLIGGPMVLSCGRTMHLVKKALNDSRVRQE